MSETQQMTRAEACKQLWDKQQLSKQEALLAEQSIPNYFDDHAAATTLVRWIKKQSVDIRENFQRHFAEIVSEGADTRSVRFFDALLATPEQITLAACQTLGLQVE